MTCSDTDDIHRLAVDTELVVEPGVSAEVTESGIVTLVREVLTREQARGAWTVVIALTTDQRLRALHRDYMGIDAETDVMTFPVETEPGAIGLGGDIVISVDRARDQAGDYGHTTEDEVRFLIVHGLLHLCGWTDRMPAQRQAMLDRQTQLLAAIGGAESV